MTKKVRHELTPQFLAAAHRSKPSSLLEKMLEMTETVRQDVLLPASLKIDDLAITRKANEGMVASDAKTVTIQTDRDCEDTMQRLLKASFPDAFVLGEEMFGAATKAEKVELLKEALSTEKMVFLVDALDATRDFTQGGDGFGVMVTAMQNGKVLAAVVHRATDHASPDNLGHTMTYEESDGVRYDGARLKSLSDRTFKTSLSQLRGYAAIDFVAAMKDGAKPTGYPNLNGKFDSVSDLWTCSKMYTDLLTGQYHFMLVAPPVDLFDYPAGIALLTKSGGVAKFLDGTPATFEELVKRQGFSRADGDESYRDVRNTMVLAVSEQVFDTVQKTVLSALPAAPVAAAKGPKV